MTIHAEAQDRRTARRHRPAGLSDAARNAGWMMGARGVQAILSLVYLAIAARTLGPTVFGQFALILTAGQAVVSFVSCQNWQVIVRFGMAAFRDGKFPVLRRLCAYCVTLDLISFAAGTLIAYAISTPLTHWLGWSQDVAAVAFWFGVAMLLSLSSTPLGILRLFDRYDSAASAEAVVPVLRAAGAVIAAWAESGLGGFLIAWAAAEIACAAAYWILARRISNLPGRLIGLGRLQAVLGEHPGLLRFTMMANAGATLAYASRPAMQLMVGGVAGAAATGSYRVAQQIGGSASKLSQILSRSLFPEFVRDRHDARAGGSQILLRRVVRMVAAGGGMVMLGIIFGGQWMIGLLAGAGFEDAYPLLLLLAAASLVDLLAAACEPALVAAGRQGTALSIRLAATATLFPLAWVFYLIFGMAGIAGAVLVSAMCSAALLLYHSRAAIAR